MCATHLFTNIFFFAIDYFLAQYVSHYYQFFYHGQLEFLLPPFYL